MNPELAVSPARVRALLAKEALDLRQARVLLVPAALVLLFVALPFLVVVLAPSTGGHGLADDDTARMLALAVEHWPALAALSPEAAAQAFLFQQFLLMLVLGPVTGAMAIAAHSVVGEKQARTLEPMLATPVTTADLLLAKTLAAFVPALAMMVVSVSLYGLGVAVLAEPGVFRALVTAHTAVVVAGIGPLATLIGLQLTVIMSSRVNDQRSAQQIGTLVVLPVVGLMVVQSLGLVWVTLPWLVAIVVGLAAVVVVLMLAGIALFDRERILTRWA